LTREHVKGAEANSSAPVKPVVIGARHRCNATSEAEELRRKYEERLNRHQGIGLTGGHHVSS